MSTKAIRELIERAKRDAGPIARGAVGWPDAGLMADKALLEVHAIEQAVAESLRLMHDEYPEDCVGRVIDLLRPIAKDAP